MLGRLDSAAVNVPVPGGARLTYLVGQWAQEFQIKHVEIERGSFGIGSTQGVSGHDYAPWLAAQDAADRRRSGDADLGRLAGLVGLVAHRRAGGRRSAAAGARGPRAAGGRGAAARGRHADHPGTARRLQSGRASTAWPGSGTRSSGPQGAPRNLRPRPVLYNSWEATGFRVEQRDQLELAGIAASIGAELFVVDDGWFIARPDDTAGLGDWEPDPAAFPDGFGAFVEKVRASGSNSGSGSSRRRSAPDRSCSPSIRTGSTRSTAVRPR